jgi:predicted unusual protein kinase regulating ubiquinone biosynthesis (AarF/ABC1/UbiB family)
VRAGGRKRQLAALGARLGADYAATAARKVFASAERRVTLDRQRELRTATAVKERLGNMKGALMKLGQMASYVDEGLPEPLRLALAELQSNAPPMSAELAAEVVERELGAPPDKVFVEWDRDPIAADLRNADMLGALLKQGFGGLDPSDMVAEVKERLTDELDYELEATNQQLFAEFYADHPFISVPAVLPSLSTARVLTTDLVNGATWQELLTWPQHERDLAGECLFRFVFRSLYGMHAFNGDPHPGNYLFHGDGRVTFLDFGLVKHFTNPEIDTFVAMVRAAAHQNDPVAFRATLESAGMLRAGAPVSDVAVGEYFGHFYETVREDREITWSSQYASRIVRHTFDRSSPIAQYATVPRQFVFIQRINLGLYALLGELHARGNYRRIAEELWPFVQGPPSTPMAVAEQPWLSTHRR